MTTEQQDAPGLTAATYADMLDEFASECERIGQQQAYTIRGYAQPSVERGLKLKAALIERDQAKDAALARERRRVAALRGEVRKALEELEDGIAVVEDIYRRGGSQGVMIGIGLLGLRGARDSLAALAVDAPGQGEEGGDR